MKKQTGIWRKRLLAAVLLVCLLCTSHTAEAAAGIDFAQTGEITLECGVENVTFSLYRVAEMEENGGFQLCEAFSDYGLSLEEQDSEGWRTMAITLYAYISRDNILPYAEQETDASGAVSFETIPTGLYLIAGEAYQDSSVSYQPTPWLLSVPEKGADGGWNYHLTVKPKASTSTLTACTVLKVWEEEPDLRKRPAQITVQLLRTKDGSTQVYEEQILNEENNWQYRWEALDGTCQWSVVEKEVPEGYTVRVSQNQTCFTITNTYQTSAGSSTPPASSAEERLPQTGMLWWPVPLLAAAGLICLLAGACMRKRQEK